MGQEKIAVESVSSKFPFDSYDDNESDHQLDETTSLPIAHHLISSNSLQELETTADHELNQDEIDEKSIHSDVKNQQDQKTEKTQKQSTPLPWGKLFIVFFLYLCDNLRFTSLMPYVTFMIADFKLTEHSTEYGYYVGLVAASYFLSQFVSSFFWGSISDSIGRRPVLLFGTFFGGICGLMFGFSKWLWWACLCRFMLGLLNGNMGVVKSYLGEITDSTNQARAFSLTGITFGLSSMLGPMIGGLLSRPYQQYPNFVLLFPEWIQNIVIQFPYIIPNVFITFFAMIGFSLGYLKLEETNKNSWYYKKFIAKGNEIEMPLQQNGNVQITDSKQNLLATPTDDLEEQDDQQLPIIVKETFLQKLKNRFDSIRKHEMLASPVPLTTCILYFMLGSKQLIFDECFPLFAVMPIEDGGLGMSSYGLGLLGGFLGIILFIDQLFVAPFIMKKFSPLTCYRLSILADTLTNIVFPEIIWLVATKDDPLWKHILFWGAIGLILLTKIVTNGYTFLGTFLITNNSVSKKNYGKLNGTAQSIVALSRMISPIAGGAIFASSVSVSKFPIDHRTVFYVISLISIIMFLLSLILKKSINKPKEESSNNE